MRFLSWFLCLLLVGCARVQVTKGPPRPSRVVSPRAQATAPEQTARALPPPEETEPAQPSTIPDLRTRQAGSDWPRFLGPTGDSVSPEKGIIAPWPKEGLRVVWHAEAGRGYGMPTISRGRLFLFDRVGAERPPPLSEERDRRSVSGPSSTRPTTRISTATTAARAAARWWTATASTSTAPEGMLHCLRRGGRQAALEGGHLGRLRRRAELLRRRQHAGGRGRPADRPGRRQPQAGPDDAPTVRPARADGSGVVAFDKYTGKVKYHVSDELASYASPGAGDDRRPALVLRVRARRPDRLGAGQRQGRLSLSLAGAHPRKRQRQQPAWWSATASSSPRPTAPAAPARGQAGRLRGGLDRRRQGPRQEPAMPLEHADLRRRLRLRLQRPAHADNAELRCIELATGKVMWRQPRLRPLLAADGGRSLHLSDRGGPAAALGVNPSAVRLSRAWT